MPKNEPGRRRNLWIPDALWERVVKATGDEQAKTGERVTVSQWIRRAIAKALGIK